MSDWIEQDGKKYFEEGYLRASNAAVARRDETIAALEAENARLREARAEAFGRCLKIALLHEDHGEFRHPSRGRYGCPDEIADAIQAELNALATSDRASEKEGRDG